MALTKYATSLALYSQSTVITILDILNSIDEITSWGQDESRSELWFKCDNADLDKVLDKIKKLYKNKEITNLHLNYTDIERYMVTLEYFRSTKQKYSIEYVGGKLPQIVVQLPRSEVDKFKKNVSNKIDEMLKWVNDHPLQILSLI